MLIGISGKKGSGKNTVANIIAKQQVLGNTKHNYYDFAFAAMLKFLLENLVDQDTDFDKNSKNKLGLCDNNGKIYTIRELLQLIGTKLRDIDPDIWIKALDKDTRGYSDVMITDVRFLNEAEYIKSKGGLLVRINRPNLEEDQHISETELDNYSNWDYVIKNDGTMEDLVHKVNQMIKDLEL